MMGMPGVGKGTFAARLSKDYNVPAISLGDEIRGILKGKEETLPPKFKQIRSIVNSGALIDDNLAFEILQTRLAMDDCAKGYILDGYPRTVPQADIMFENKVEIDLVLYLIQNEDVITQKLLGRRNCEDCGWGCNVADIKAPGYDLPPLLPKTEGICDKCGGKLVERQDDNEETIRQRIFEYNVKTSPLVDYFKQKGIMLEYEAFEGVGGYNTFSKMLADRLANIP